MQWLKQDNEPAFNMRYEIITKYGNPTASSIRPEGNCQWVFFGCIAAVCFMLLGW